MIKKHLLLFLLMLSTSSALADDHHVSKDFENEFNNDNIPVVLTATRLKQPQSEAPASVTVIDKAMLQSLGIHKLAEIFRLVPGMQVGYVSGNKPAVGYHGLTDDNSRRIQILIDGRSVYKEALSRILWEDMPISINHIAKIEVIRGPNTASYGANSYLAIINIISEHPDDQIGWSLSGAYGKRGVKSLEASFADINGPFEYRVSLLHQGDNGFDLAQDKLSPRYDSESGNSILFDGIHQQGNDQLRIKAGFKNNRRQLPPTFAEVSPYHNLQNQQGYFQLNYHQNITPNRNREIQLYFNTSDIQEEWNVCLPKLLITNELFDLYSLDAQYTETFLAAISAGMSPPAPTSPQVAAQAALVFNRVLSDGLINTCGSANQNLTEQRLDFEWQETFRLNDDMRMIGGVNVRNDSAKAESFLRKRESKNSGRLFSHFEWRLSRDRILNLGGNLEYDGDSGTEFSPRAALIQHVGENHTFRAVTAFATRTPDLFEESGFRTYKLRNLEPQSSFNDNDLFYQHSQSNGDLRSEKIRSYELGYFGDFLNSRLLIDAKIFRDSLYQILVGNSKLTDFNLQNSGSIRFHGFETQIDYHFNSNLRFWTSYSHVKDNVKVFSFNQRSVIKDSGAFAIFYQSDNHWHLASAFYANGTWFGQKFARNDTSLSYDFNLNGGWKLQTRLTWQHRFDDNFLFDSNNVYKDKDTYFMQFSLLQND